MFKSQGYRLPVICLMGPTAIGKTDIAIELYTQLVKKLPIDIISVDSAMVYRGLNIGSGKPSPELLADIPHKLVNIREPYEIYSVADFCADALDCINKAHLAYRLPLLVGGTMMYFKSLQEGLTQLPSSDETIRSELTLQLKNKGIKNLYQDLMKIDSIAASRINPNDTQRILRALEVYFISGQNMTELLVSKQNNDNNLFAKFNNINLIMEPSDRAILHENIAKRFYKMLDAGFVEEVRGLLSEPKNTLDLPALRSCGYQQVGQYLLGNLTEEEMIDKSIIATRQLAKRQLTWLRSWKQAKRYSINNIMNYNDRDNLVIQILQVIADHIGCTNC